MEIRLYKLVRELGSYGMNYMSSRLVEREIGTVRLQEGDRIFWDGSVCEAGWVACGTVSVRRGDKVLVPRAEMGGCRNHRRIFFIYLVGGGKIELGNEAGYYEFRHYFGTPFFAKVPK